MAISNGLIIAPVSIYDVQQTLGTSNNDVGTLCRQQNVNKWAKYKPVPNDIIDTTPELESDKTWKSTATWWKAKNGKCGLSYIPQPSVAYTKDAIDSKHVVWSRVAPAGNDTEPYRLIDFNTRHSRRRMLLEQVPHR